MNKALLITGNTYPARRAIKALGGKWNPERSGWLAPVSDQARKLAEDRGFSVEEVDVDPILLETPTGERLRAIRQDKLDRCSASKLARAERLEAKAGELGKSLEPYDDWAFWTEPIKIGHHSEHRHRRLRERLQNKMRKQSELLGEASGLRAEARPQKARIAGDAERQRERKREQLDQAIGVGSRVVDFSFGPGTVVRVNRKSYTVEYDRGFKCARDKTYFRPE